MISLPLKILIIGVLLYLGFAIWHHKKDKQSFSVSKNLTYDILLEYVLTAILVLVIVMGVTF